MRPLYETPKDRIKQRDFLDEIEKELGWVITEVPRSYHIEAIVQQNNKTVGVIEVKNRNHPYGHHKTIILALLKVRVGLAFASMLKVPFYFGVKWVDGPWGLFNFDEADITELYLDPKGGRTVNTRDAADEEPVLHLPLNKFHVYNVKEVPTAPPPPPPMKQYLFDDMEEVPF